MSPRDNRQELRELVGRKELDLSPAPLLWDVVDPVSVDFDRVEGMLLGVAVGDALGNPTEGLLPATRQARSGEIRDFQRTRHGLAVPSDDTQMTFWTLEHVLEHDGLDPDLLARRFAAEPIFGIGHAVREFVTAIHAGAPWCAAAPRSAGNGALMRIAPVLIPHFTTGGALWADAALAAAVTHNDSASISACVSFVSLLWQAMTLQRPPEPMWWIDEYVRVASQLETEHRYRPRTQQLDFDGTLSRFVDTEVRMAVENQCTVRAACDRWYSGAYLLETVPSVLQILALHAHDPEEAIVRAVNDTKDNDTIGAIVGAAVGALHGRQALPQRWLSQLPGRVGAADDGHIFDMIKVMRDHLRGHVSGSG
jgi:ADP-ribosylglycohydrolase